MSKLKTTPVYQPGKRGVPTMIVLSTPGKAEEVYGYPAAGRSGATLNGALEYLHERDPKRFPSISKSDYPILNVVTDVHYRCKTGRS